jgi:hypothetical protein
MYKNEYAYMPIYISIGVLLGWLLPRLIFPNVSIEAAMLIGSILVVMLTIMFVGVASISYYKVYLIRKYCPHLK